MTDFIATIVAIIGIFSAAFIAISHFYTARTKRFQWRQLKKKNQMKVKSERKPTMDDQEVKKPEEEEQQEKSKEDLIEQLKPIRLCDEEKWIRNDLVDEMRVCITSVQPLRDAIDRLDKFDAANIFGDQSVPRTAISMTVNHLAAFPVVHELIKHIHAETGGNFPSVSLLEKIISYQQNKN